MARSKEGVPLRKVRRGIEFVAGTQRKSSGKSVNFKGHNLKFVTVNDKKKGTYVPLEGQYGLRSLARRMSQIDKKHDQAYYLHRLVGDGYSTSGSLEEKAQVAFVLLFMALGLGALVFSDSSVTGNAVVESVGSVVNPFVLFGFVFIFVGIYLTFKFKSK